MKLARFEYNGSSKGWWLVRDLPGITIFKCPCGWVIDDEPSMLESSGGRAEEIWGENWNTFYLAADFPKFDTRREAVETLENYLNPKAKPKPVIGELIS